MPIDQQELTINLVRYGAGLGPSIAGLLLHLAVDLVLPGKKGKLRAERQHFYEGYTLQQVVPHMEQRLRADNFKIIPTGDAQLLRAERSEKRPNTSVMSAYPFEKTKLKVEVRFQPHPVGVGALLCVSINDYITRDTGETEYLEAFLDFLALKPDIRAVKPALNIKAHLAMMDAIVALPLPVFFLFSLSTEIANALLFGLVIASLTAIILAVWGMVEIMAAPQKHHGLKQVMIAIGLSVVMLGAGIALRFLV